jgi:hypothetical protein
MPIKRLNYFNHQFLEEQDFRDEQKYHLEMRRTLNRALHIWGVVEGLQVARSGNRELVIEPGFALDREGRELVVAKPVTRDVGDAEKNRPLHVLISYKEHTEEADRRNSGGIEGYNRITEYVEISLTHEPDRSGSGVLLATVHLDDERNIGRIDHTGRQSAGSLIAPQSVHTGHLADGSVTDQKLAPALRESLKREQFQLPDGSVTPEKLSPDLRAAFGARGWVRLAFKPLSLRPKGHQWRADDSEFYADIAYAHCDRRGARGTMGIPVPAGATKIQEFRIAGASRGSKIRVQLFRTGWNMKEKRGESVEIVNEEFVHAEFDKSFKAERELDEFHALSLAVFAEGESEIWLVAARFQ